MNVSTRVLVPDTYRFVTFTVNTTVQPLVKDGYAHVHMLNNLTHLNNGLLISLRSYCDHNVRDKRSLASMIGLATYDEIHSAQARMSALESTEHVISDQVSAVEKLTKEIYRRDKISDSILADQFLQVRMELSLLVKLQQLSRFERVLLGLLELINHGATESPEIGATMFSMYILNLVSCSRNAITVKTQLFSYTLQMAVPSDTGLTLEIGGAHVLAPPIGRKISPLAVYESVPGACPKNLHMYEMSEQFLPRKGHALKGGYVRKGCWLRPYKEHGAATSHFIMMSEELEPAISEYRPPPVGGIVLGSPPTFPPLSPPHYDWYTQAVMNYMALVFSAIALLEAVARYVRDFWRRYTCARVRGQGGDPDREMRER